MPRPTKERWERFCQAIFQGMNHTDAYYEAGFSRNNSRASAAGNAKELLNNPKVIARLAELKHKAEDKAVSTVLERKMILTEIERADLTDFLDESGEPIIDKKLPHHTAVAEYTHKTTYTKAGDPVVTKSIKLRDPVGAIAEHNKMEHIYEPDKGGVTNNTQINIIVQSVDGQSMLQRVLSGERTERELPSGNS